MVRGLRQRGQHVTFFYHITRERGLVSAIRATFASVRSIF